MFGSGAKVSLMSAFNISVGKKKKKKSPILYLRMTVSFQLFINITVPRTTAYP